MKLSMPVYSLGERASASSHKRGILKGCQYRGEQINHCSEVSIPMMKFWQRWQLNRGYLDWSETPLPLDHHSIGHFGILPRPDWKTQEQSKTCPDLMRIGLTKNLHQKTQIALWHKNGSQMWPRVLDWMPNGLSEINCQLNVSWTIPILNGD